MLVLLCVQVVQTKKNESSWRENLYIYIYNVDKQKNVKLPRKQKKSNWQDTQANN